MQENQVIEVKEPTKNKFQDDADDSSEEESVVGDITNYNVTNKWQAYADSRNTLAEKDNATKLAFISHAYGLKLLYSPGTNAEYYPLKKLILGNNQCSNESVWFKFVLERIFCEIKQRVINLPPNVDFLHYQQNYKIQIEQWSLELSALMRPLLLWLKGKPVSYHLEEMFKSIFHSFHQFFSSFFPGHEKYLLQYFLAKELCPQNVKQAIEAIHQTFQGRLTQTELFKSYTSIPINLRNIVQPYAVNQALFYLRDSGALQDGDIYSARPLKKEQRSKLLFIKNVKYPMLGVCTEKWYRHKNLSGTSHVYNYLKKDNHAKELVVALTLDFANAPADKEEQANKEFMELIAKHFNLAREDPVHRLAIERTLLPASCCLQSTSHYGFFARLRLSQQDMRRRQKQLLDERYNKQEAIMGTNHCRIWKFNSQMEAIETQELTANQGTKSFSRNDKDISFGNYDNIYHEIETIKKMINSTPIVAHNQQIIRPPECLITDPQIAEWIRKTLQGFKISDEFSAYHLISGHLKKLELCVINLTYLLFGCEGSRNPAALILHQMMLDLIIYSNYTWQQMLSETSAIDTLGIYQKYKPLMPMAMTNAVPSARVLHERFYNFMPYQYQYFGSKENENCEELLRNRYTPLISVWFQYYLKEPTKDLEQAIKDSLLRWYNVSPEQIEYQQATPYLKSTLGY